MAIDLIHGPWPQTPGLSTSPRIARVLLHRTRQTAPRRVAVILRTIPASTYFVEIDALAAGSSSSTQPAALIFALAFLRP